jgi:hypothetical protein
MIIRLVYRLRQFRNALLGSRTLIPSEILLAYITPAQLSLFRRMQPLEQVHAYKIFKSLEIAGHADPDLLAAALLHDVGKTLHPLSIFGRILIVMGKHFFRRTAQRWGEGSPRGLRQPFVVAAQHAGWSAEMTAQAGATSRTVELIRHHHDKRLSNPGSIAEHQLAALQAADDEN